MNSIAGADRHGAEKHQRREAVALAGSISTAEPEISTTASTGAASRAGAPGADAVTVTAGGVVFQLKKVFLRRRRRLLIPCLNYSEKNIRRGAPGIALHETEVTPCR